MKAVAVESSLYIIYYVYVHTRIYLYSEICFHMYMYVYVLFPNPIHDDGTKRSPYQFFLCNFYKRRN